MRFALLCVTGAAVAPLAGCPHGAVPRPAGPEPTVEDVVSHLNQARDEMHSFTGSAVMEYWLGNDRFKGDVLAMGELGSKVRIAALSPAGGSTVAEMACDGSQFVSINYQNNCVITGPCNRESIASFFGIELSPDDFLHLALGTPPVVDGAHGTVSWDGDKGLEHVELEGGGGKQTLGVDHRDQTWDVVESALTADDGKPVWTVKNGDFTDVKDADGKPHRVPGKSRFTTPARQKADLSVEWHERTVNVTIDPKKFTIAVPAGLPTCGAKKS